MSLLKNTFSPMIWEMCWKFFKKSKTNSERNEIQVSTIKNGLRDLKEEITNMSEEEKKSKNQMK